MRTYRPTEITTVFFICELDGSHSINRIFGRVNFTDLSDPIDRVIRISWRGVALFRNGCSVDR
jgi:hypothetical protein